MKSIICNRSLVGVRDEDKAKQVIADIQHLQDRLHGKHFYNWQFNGNTLAELIQIKFALLDELRAKEVILSL